MVQIRFSSLCSFVVGRYGRLLCGSALSISLLANCSMDQLWFSIGTVLPQLKVASCGAFVVQLVA